MEKETGTLSEIPPELQDHFFLHFLALSKYVAVLYSGEGEPLWAVNRSSHKHNFFVDKLCHAPISANYQLPPFRQLDDFFAKEETPAAGRGSPNAIREMALKAFGHANIPAFHSKNIFEKKFLGHPFTLSIPLTNLSLLKIAPGKFLGVISFSDFFHEFQLLHERPALVADSDGKIAGFNDALTRFLPGNGSTGLLGKPLSSVVALNEPPRPAIPLPVFEPLFQWRFPGDPPFRLEGENHAPLQKTSRGWLWENASANDYRYLEFEWREPLDGRHLDLEMEYLPLSGGIPNLILRGCGREPDMTPDAYGYSLVSTTATGQLIFKKASWPVAFFPAGGQTEAEPARLKIEKRFDRFAFYLNHRSLGTWRETAPFSTPPGGRLFLFLRPGERVILRAVTLRAAPYTPAEAAADRPHLTAEVHWDNTVRHFNVTVQQRALEYTNFTLYHFEDVTALRNDLSLLKNERDRLAALLKQPAGGGFVGRSPAMLEIRAQLDTVARSNLSVLIEGETGTGKEVLARALKEASPRREGPFVKLDCSALPESLLESELFGHARGAFTGAVSDHAGRFEQARDGVLFLDEVGNLSLGIQAKLLGVLQDFSVQRVGGGKSIPLNVRLITASNVPLKQLIAQGRFREDLYYRLNQYRFQLPALRERREDIPLLAQAFLGEGNLLYGKRVKGFTAAALNTLCAGKWPGNVRELRNAVLRAVLFAKSARVAPEETALEEAPEKPKPAPGRRGGVRTRVRLPREDFAVALAEARGNVSVAARRLSMSRFMAYKLLRKWKLTPDPFRPKEADHGRP